MYHPSRAGKGNVPVLCPLSTLQLLASEFQFQLRITLGLLSSSSLHNNVRWLEQSWLKIGDKTNDDLEFLQIVFRYDKI